MGAVVRYLPLSGLIILLLLVVQFNSIRKTGLMLFPGKKSRKLQEQGRIFPMVH